MLVILTGFILYTYQQLNLAFAWAGYFWLTVNLLITCCNILLTRRIVTPTTLNTTNASTTATIEHATDIEAEKSDNTEITILPTTLTSTAAQKTKKSAHLQPTPPTPSHSAAKHKWDVMDMAYYNNFLSLPLIFALLVAHRILHDRTAFVHTKTLVWMSQEVASEKSDGLHSLHELTQHEPHDGALTIPHVLLLLLSSFVAFGMLTNRRCTEERGWAGRGPNKR